MPHPGADGFLACSRGALQIRAKMWQTRAAKENSYRSAVGFFGRAAVSEGLAAQNAVLRGALQSVNRRQAKIPTAA